MAHFHRLTYVVFGAIASIGAPAGLLVLRFASGSTNSLSAELVAGRLTYSYVLLASAIAFAIFGYILGRQADSLQELSMLDPLTGLLNRRAVEEQLQREFRRVRRYGAPLSLLLVDLDGLKRVNDVGGHTTGDRILRGAAAAIRQTLRGSDYGARWGGDEFVILAPHTSPTAARRLAERVVLRVKIATRSTNMAPRFSRFSMT